MPRSCSHSSFLALIASSIGLAGTAQAQWSHFTVSGLLPSDALRDYAAADIDGDGDLDVVVGGESSGELHWYENTGAQGPWPQHAIASLPQGLRAFSVGDIDGDSDADVLYAGPNGGVWVENDGLGSFSVQHVVAMPPNNYVTFVSCDLGDIDGDGDLDLVAGLVGSGVSSNYAYKNVGGTFFPVQNLNSLSTRGLFLRDLDFDGDLDVVSQANPSFGVRAVVTHTNDGQGTMTVDAVLQNADAQYAQFVDFDLDGDSDFISVQRSMVTWRERLPSGLFGPNLALVPDPGVFNLFIYGAELADMDGDGIEDLLLHIRPTTNPSADNEARVAWYRIPGDGTLEAPIAVRPDPSYEAAIGFCVADMDGDGDMDVMGAERSGGIAGNRIRFHRNERTLETQVCPGEINSSGERGRLEFTGSDVATQNRCIARALDAPAAEFGLFVVGNMATAPQMLPGGAGTLCLGGNVGRFNQSIGQVRSDGTYTYTLDLTAVPTSTGTEWVVAGETRFFAFWHRDSGSSNVTETVAVSFR